MINRKTSSNRQQIISEYLSGSESYQALAKRYGVKARTIQSMVRAFRKQQPSTVDKPSVVNPVQQFHTLQKQLENTTLKNELLEEMIRLAGQHTGIDIKKKFGTRQS